MGKFQSDIRRFEMHAEIVKWGNSLGLPFPGSIAEEAGVVEGAVVDLRVKDGNLIMRIGLSDAINLEDLLNEITDEIIHGKIDTGDTLGGEIW